MKYHVYNAHSNYLDRLDTDSLCGTSYAAKEEPINKIREVRARNLTLEEFLDKPAKHICKGCFKKVLRHHLSEEQRNTAKVQMIQLGLVQL